MSIHIEVELVCNGYPGDQQFTCTTPPIFALTATEARRCARRDGWLTGARRDGRTVDICPTHRTPRGAAA